MFLVIFSCVVVLFGDCVYYQVRSAMAVGRPRTPALTIAVTLWKVE